MKKRKLQIGMRPGLLLLCLGILVLFCLLFFLVCNSFLVNYYVLQTENGLINAFETICADSEVSWQTMASLEQENLTILVYRKEDGKLVYNSQYEHERFDPLHDFLFSYISDRLTDEDTSYFIETIDDASPPLIGDMAGLEQYYTRSIFLGGDTGVYVVQISAKMEAIETSMGIAMQFMLVVMLVIMLLSAILILILSTRITRPVEEMSTVAAQIAGHDFTQHCKGSGIREMQDLSDNINSISDQMQTYIHELEEANAQLKNDLDRMEKTEQARKELVSNISHDLKTPIALISGYADGLRSGMVKSPEQIREYCDVISDETDRMLDMLVRMLEVSRLESGTVDLVIDDIDLVEELESLLSSFRVELSRRDITLEKDFPDSIYIRSDSLCVEQVLMNYIQNAISHMGEGNRMRVSISGREMVRVSVFNSSPPLSDEERERIWETFYRGEKSRTRETRQSGLGLAIVRGNMELLNLPYGVQNVEGGVEFWAEFPVSPFELSAPPEDPEL